MKLTSLIIVDVLQHLRKPFFIHKIVWLNYKQHLLYSDTGCKEKCLALWEFLLIYVILSSLLIYTLFILYTSILLHVSTSMNFTLCFIKNVHFYSSTCTLSALFRYLYIIDSSDNTSSSHDHIISLSSTVIRPRQIPQQGVQALNNINNNIEVENTGSPIHSNRSSPSRVEGKPAAC